MSVVTLLFLVFALALVNMLAGTAGLRAFLSHTRSIASTIDLEAFKRLVRRQMFQALLQMGLLGAGLVLGIYALVKEEAGLLLILALNGIIFASGQIGKGFEERARSLKVADPLLENRYKAVCHTWVHKPFPDF